MILSLGQVLVRLEKLSMRSFGSTSTMDFTQSKTWNASTADSSMGFPGRSCRDCFGSGPPARKPCPPAGKTTPTEGRPAVAIGDISGPFSPCAWASDFDVALFAEEE